MIADSADRLSAGGCSRCRGAGLPGILKEVKLACELKKVKLAYLLKKVRGAGARDSLSCGLKKVKPD